MSLVNAEPSSVVGSDIPVAVEVSPSLDDLISSLLSSGQGVKGKKVKPLSGPLGPRPVEAIPEVADALVVVAVRVTCKTCGQTHVGSSHVMRRIPRRDGVHYKPVVAPIVDDLPRLVQWAFEEIETCWRCFDLYGPPEAPVPVPGIPRYITPEEREELGNFEIMMKSRLAPLPPQTAFRLHELRVLAEKMAPQGPLSILEPKELAFRSASDTFLNVPKGENE